MKINYITSKALKGKGLVDSIFKFKALLVLFVVLFGINTSFAQSPSTYTADGTFTVPLGVTSITIDCIGAGGAGGSARGNNDRGAGGGAGGQYARSTIAVAAGQVYTVTVAGITLAPSGSNNTDGNTGAFSEVTRLGTTHARANGGAGGISGSGTRLGGVANITGAIGNIVVRRGGNGGDGTATESGAGGGGAGTTGNGGNATGTTAGVGATLLGGNGGAGRTTTNSGIAGANYGGGGSGGRRDNTGGNGAQGYVQITYTCPALVSNAGTNQTLAACATTATLAANTPVNATGAWTVVSGSGVVTTPTSPTSGVTGIVPGTPLVLRWTVSNGSCGSTNSTVTITSPTGAGCLSYCASNATSGIDSMISNVTFNTINNTTTACATYTNFTAISTTVIKTSAYNLTIAKNDCDGGTNFTGRFAAWIDWNQNGTFEAGEQVLTDAVASVGPITVSVTVPAIALTGTTRMRCVFVEGTTAPTACGTYNWGETEDYTVNVVDPLPCTAPIAQPTALVLTPGTTISGSFTAPSPAPNNYLVVVSTSATPPSPPVLGTTYAIGSTLGAGYTIVDNDGNTTFTASGLTPLTTYYFYIYSFNSACTGGPRYLGTSPLTGNATTTAVSYCIPTISNAFQTATTHHIRKVEFIGTVQEIVNTSTFPAVAPFGYTDFTGLATMAIQAKGEAVNIYMESPNSGYIKAWIDWNKDGDFLDAGETIYDAGGVAQASTTLGFVVSTAIATGDYRVRLRISGRNVSGADAGASWNACTTNLAYFGETEDYILRVIDNCVAKITTVTDGFVCGSGTVTLNVTGSGSPTGFRWYNTVGTLLGDTAAGTWTTPSITTTTEYYVTAYNATCESLFRTKITAEVRPVPTLTFATSTTEVCGENSVVALTATGDNEVLYLLNEKFEGGMGTFTNVHYTSNPAVNATTAWQVHTSPYVPTGTTWFPAIASNFGSNNFAFVNSDIGQAPAPPGSYYTVDNGLVSNTVNSTGFLNLTLYFRMYFDRYFPDTTFPTQELMTVDVSTDAGATWTAISGNIIDDRGYGSKFIPFAFNLDAYINQTNLKVRIRYFTNTWANGAAVDDIQLYGTKPLSTALQWSGTPLPDVYTDAATTIPYVSGTPATTVYVKPALSQLENGSYTFTATASLTNGCNVSQNITINNKSNIWKGTISDDWNNPNNWSPPVVPDANSCVIIPAAPFSSNIIGTNYNGFGKTLIVKSTGRLDIQPTNTLTIGNTVTVDAGGVFNLENSSSLIQIDNVANSGVINMKRTALAGSLDYVYWSTPVAGFSINNVLPTTGTQYRYYWTPTIDNGGTYAGNFGNWAAAAGAMTTGRGYIKRGSGGTTNFIGNPNNGNISIPITRDTYNLVTPYVGPTLTPVTRDDDNWNLLGNPYPSAINAVDFLAANTNISGFVKVWSHGTLPVSAVDPFYQDFVLNYTTADYITTNGVGSTPPGYDGRIGAGQGFFVLMNHSAATPGTVVFNNGMRSNAHRNDQFYRSSDEQNRIWLNLVSPSNASSTTLVGYVSDATNNLDRDFDAIAQGVKTNFELYSIAESQELVIQGRSLPFNQDDEVTLGVSIPQNGIYTIAISTVDGLFANASQDIYLEDKQLGTFHDLRIAPYTFTGTTGTDENRFVLRYTNGRLGTDDLEVLANNILVVTNENVTIKSTNIAIQSVTIHDVLGRVISNKKNVNANTVTFDALQKNNTTLLVKIELANGTIVNKKVIF